MKKFLAIILLLLSLTGISYAAETEVIGLNVTEYGGKTIYGGLTIVPTLGAEKAIDGTFTVGTCAAWTFNVTDWTCGAANMAKDQDGTNALSQDMTEVAGEVYKVTIDVTGFSAGTFIVQVGNTNGQTVTSADGATQSITQYHTAIDGTNFTITPSNDSRFVLDNISVKKVNLGGLSLYNSLNLYGGQLLLSNAGILASPTIKIGQNAGLWNQANQYYGGANNSLDIVISGVHVAQFASSPALVLRSNASLGWSSTTPGDAAVDTILERGAAGLLKLTSTSIAIGGDGGGLASTTGITNAVDTTTTNAYVVGGGQVATTKNTGWVKVYIGTDAAWIPYWTNASP